MIHTDYIFWRNVASRASDGQTSLAAAGCGFFATLALFPALGALIPLYGLVFDVQSIEPQLQILQSLMPPDAYILISDYVRNTVAQSELSLTFGVIFAFLASLWAAAAASKSVLTAINMTYGYEDTRSILHFQSLGIFTTILGILGGILAIALMVAAPGLASHVPDYLQNPYMHVPENISAEIIAMTPFVAHWIAPGVMLLFVCLTIVFLYRFAPCWPEVNWLWILPGSIVGTLMWIIASFVFSWYMTHFSMAGSLYGPLGTVAIVMLWFFVSVYAVLFGAVINVEIRERAREERRSGPSLQVKLKDKPKK